MGERIKRIRKELGLTQQQFADQLGTERGNIAGYETGRRSPSDAMTSLICKTFNVNDMWLRTGEGEMLNQQSSFDLSEYARERGATELDIEIVKIYLELEPEVRKKAIAHFQKRLADLDKRQTFIVDPAPSQPVPVSSISLENDTAARMTELERQNQELRQQNATFAARIEILEEKENLRQEEAKKREDAWATALYGSPASSGKHSNVPASVTNNKNPSGGD